MKRILFLSVLIIPTIMFATACEPCPDECEFDNFYEVRSMSQTYCYCDPDILTHCEEVCPYVFVLPAEENGCRMWLDGYMSFEDTFKGFGSVELRRCWVCPGMATECEEMALVFGTYFYDEGEQELWYFDNGDAAVFDVILTNQELVLTLDDGGGGTMQIVLDNKGPVENCNTSQDVGRCYTRANCAGGMLLGCVSKEACVVALDQLGVTGSWRPRGGGACVSPLP